MNRLDSLFIIPGPKTHGAEPRPHDEPGFRPP